MAVVFLYTAALGYAGEAVAPTQGLQRHVVFSDYADASRSLEVARRLLTPLTHMELLQAATRVGLRDQAIDLQNELFSVYVPASRPSRGYGLLVFVPPWREAALPAGWDAVLDESGMIFVTAARSGNEENILDRRIPLALLAAYNLMQRYPVDPDRVYVGGFSGGARVALRVALGYPDLFHGAFLNAGSDAIGHRSAALPPGELFAEFQDTTRIDYATGTDDGVNMNLDMGSRASMRGWCEFNTQVDTIYRQGHEVAGANSLRRALAYLDRRSPGDPAALSACRAGIARQVNSAFEKVAHLLDLGKSADARRQLRQLDARYAGLAAAQITALESRLASKP
jgi:hypothetical protein